MTHNPKIVIAYFRSQGLPEPEFEFKFCEMRKFRFDIAFPSQKVAIEVQGGLWIKGAHSRPVGIKRDMSKRNLATILGWKIIEVQPKELLMLQTVELLKKCLKTKRQLGK